MTIGISADWLRWSNFQRSRITGQANTTMRQRNHDEDQLGEQREHLLRTVAGIMPTITSMRSWRPDHATTPLPRNTQPTMRKSMTSSAQ